MWPDIEWVGREQEIEEALKKAGFEVSVGRIDRERFTVITGIEENEEIKNE